MTSADDTASFQAIEDTQLPQPPNSPNDVMGMSSNLSPDLNHLIVGDQVELSAAPIANISGTRLQPSYNDALLRNC
jgi:hypothetical protein